MIANRMTRSNTMARIKETKGHASQDSINAARNLNKRAKVAEKEMREFSQVEKMQRGRRKLTDKEKTPSARFERVAGIRIAKVCKLLKALEACTNPDVYFSTERQRQYGYSLVRAAYISFKQSWLEPREKEGKTYKPHKLHSVFENMPS